MSTSTLDRTRLPLRIATAARIVAPLWPIERFIAVNPLGGVLDLGFEGAAREASRSLGATCLPDAPGPSPRERSDVAPRSVLEHLDRQQGTNLAEVVDSMVAQWCASLLEPSAEPARLIRIGADNEGPPSGSGLFAAWREIAAHDARLRRLVPDSSRHRMAEVPAEADLAVLWALGELGVDPAEAESELRGQLARLPGWAGYAKWCDEWATADDPFPRLALVELLAMRLVTEALLAAELLRAAELPEQPRSGWEPAPPEHPAGLAALEAAEQQYRRELLERLDGVDGASTETGVEGAPTAARAQLVHCIDVRSEGLRRHIEEVGPYETIGFAGFFAAPIRFRSLGSSESYPSAPVLITPELEVAETPLDEAGARSGIARRRRSAVSLDTFDHVAHGPLAMFQLAEMAGWVLGPAALVRSAAPAAMRVGDATAKIPTAISYDGPHGFDLDSATVVAENALRTMGLTRGFAPLVVFCGHEATTTANPHAASLDCGACAGNPGAPNARAAAAICNDPAVRERLRHRGIDVPDSTLFLAASHNTTTDEVEVLDAVKVPPDRAAEVEALAADLAEAGTRNADERMRRLPGERGTRKGRARGRRRARDWAQTRPEWGLARNASFIVAPRDLTRGVDLDGRAFLHSYDPEADDDGSVLETILTAPMVVGHWINAQYYFSTVDPDHFGAGDKTLHNPVAGIGVLEGSGGDLRVGLPWQSVGHGTEPYHEPVRLLTVVEAPIERIEAVIARNTILQQLLDGAWVHLVADPAGGTWMRRAPGGTWSPEPTEANPAPGKKETQP